MLQRKFDFELRLMGPNRLTGPEKLEKVLEKLATTDKTTLACERLPEGKIRVTSSAWADEKVILKGQVLEVRNVDGRLHVDDENVEVETGWPSWCQNYGSPECAHHR